MWTKVCFILVGGYQINPIAKIETNIFGESKGKIERHEQVWLFLSFSRYSMVQEVEKKNDSEKKKVQNKRTQIIQLWHTDCNSIGSVMNDSPIKNL